MLEIAASSCGSEPSRVRTPSLKHTFGGDECAVNIRSALRIIVMKMTGVLSGR